MNPSQQSNLRYLLISTLFILPVSSAPTSSAQNDLLLIVSCDGFRWDFIDMVKLKGRATPNFDFLIRSGTKAEYMKSAFVTHTWPNHWTMATGMHVETHGVVANTFYDPVYDDVYDSPDTPDPKWYNNGTEGGGGEPIWVTYEKAGPDHRSAAAVWPASTTKVRGRVPKYTLPQDNEIAMEDRVDAVIKWFTLLEEPAGLGLLYFGEPDAIAHEFGPDSQKVEDTVVEMDGVIGYLLDQLRNNKLLHRTNLVITSDHGSTRITDTFPLDTYVDPTWYIMSGESPNLMFLPTEGHEDELIDGLKKVPHSKLVRKEDIPRRLHYTYNRRILPLVLMMDYGYMACCYNGSLPRTAVAEHGWDPVNRDMNPFFIAHGPAFKSDYISRPFNNTDLYSLMCHLLGIEPHPNNGSLDNIKHILAHEGQPFQYAQSGQPSTWMRFSKSAITFIIAFGVAFCVIIFYVFVKDPRKKKRIRSVTVDVPANQPEFAVAEQHSDRRWLLHSEEQQDSESEVEEWTPIRPNSIHNAGICRAVVGQTPI